MYVLKSDKPVLVDFWATWCGPCRMVAPILEEIAKDHGDKLEIVKLNVDENPKTPGNLGIVGIPALFVYKDGEVVKQIIGATRRQLALERARKADQRVAAPFDVDAGVRGDAVGDDLQLPRLVERAGDEMRAVRHFVRL